MRPCMPHLFPIEVSVKGSLPLMVASVPAGFPSPAEDYLEDELELKSLLVRRPAATYFLRVRGASMEGAGILDGAIVVVDRSLAPQSGDVIIAVVDGEMTLKYLQAHGAGWILRPGNPEFPAIEVKAGQTLDCWGVVTAAINQFTRR